MPKHTTYSPADAGCYVDGVHGIYATDEIVAFARSHGARITHDADCDHVETCSDSEFAGCEWAGDYEDEADTFMNAKYATPGHYWGRNDNGDWGLWPVEDN